jgi:hypothetical protein
VSQGGVVGRTAPQFKAARSWCSRPRPSAPGSSG